MQDNLGDKLVFTLRALDRNPSTPSANTERAFGIWAIKADEDVSKLTPREINLINVKNSRHILQHFHSIIKNFVW